MPKDLFSAQANDYARYRPTYPPELFDYILGFVNGKERAWDCATGNGQAALVLADHFKTVEATDLSEAQLKNAPQRENVRYSVSTAEQTKFADNSFDLITVATAYHWFRWKDFYAEATRVGKAGCVVAAWGYHVFYSADAAITAVIQHFYHHIIKPYWDAERRYVEDRYATVEFDFAPLPEREFDLVLHWRKEDLTGYLSTWSAVQHYQKQHGRSPLELIAGEVENAWPDNEEREFHFPLFLRLGRVEK